jgi:hypothetical protein
MLVVVLTQLAGRIRWEEAGNAAKSTQPPKTSQRAYNDPVPPRFAYWTILIDNAPTAFRARDPQELLPTLNQLKRTNKDVTMKWFARGRLWESQEQEREDFQRRKRGAERTASWREREARGKDWRPGGQHQDPRARFDKQKQRRDPREQRQADALGDKPRFGDRRPAKFSDRRPAKFNDRHRSGDRRPTDRPKPFGRPDSKASNQRSFNQRSAFNRPKGGPGKQHGRRGPESRPREEIRNRGKDKWRGERPRREERRDERRDQPERKEQEPPPPRPDRPTDVPEPPPKPEQIIIKPDPPERG